MGLADGYRNDWSKLERESVRGTQGCRDLVEAIGDRGRRDFKAYPFESDEGFGVGDKLNPRADAARCAASLTRFEESESK